MKLKLNNIAKRYRLEWIFRNLTYTFEEGNSYAILGANGSGKSTLLRLLSGHLSPSKGMIVFERAGTTVDSDQLHRYLSYAAPYIDLIEEFTLLEAIQFHQRFKPFQQQLSPSTLIELLQFSKSKDKQIRYFSSGMKQRLKLVLALCSDTPLLLLDEPTTNLDRQGMKWYLDLVEQFGKNRLLIVASNVEEDYGFCDKQLHIMDYK